MLNTATYTSREDWISSRPAILAKVRSINAEIIMLINSGMSSQHPQYEAAEMRRDDLEFKLIVNDEMYRDAS